MPHSGLSRFQKADLLTSTKTGLEAEFYRKVQELADQTSQPRQLILNKIRKSQAKMLLEAPRAARVPSRSRLDKELDLLNPPHWEKEIVHAEHGRVQSAVTGPKGILVATISPSCQNAVQVFALSAKKSLKLLLTLDGHDGAVTSAVFSYDGQHLVTSSKDGLARIWKLRDGCLVNYQRSLEGNALLSAQISPHGRYIFTITDNPNRSLESWNITSGKRDAFYYPSGPHVYYLPGEPVSLSRKTQHPPLGPRTRTQALIFF